MRIKKGDTLIEVAIAIGIFSMVAVAVISVVSGSTSNAQSSLETTVTREEIDTQAEALRFIQSAYIAGGRSNAEDSSGNLQKYAGVWDEITSKAVDTTAMYNSEEAEKVLRFNPTTCAEVYDSDDLFNQGAFVINTRMLGNINSDLSNLSQVVVRADKTKKNNPFFQTSTYPRIIYGPYSGEAAIDSLLEQSFYTNISRVEGIFVVAVKDPGTSIVSSETTGSTSISERSAYYDFYIRTCWYNPGASTPATISTVIRLQDPSVINYGTH